jgi:iron only hydrogenase large subunit-like protein
MEIRGCFRGCFGGGKAATERGDRGLMMKNKSLKTAENQWGTGITTYF